MSWREWDAFDGFGGHGKTGYKDLESSLIE